MGTSKSQELTERATGRKKGQRKRFKSFVDSCRVFFTPKSAEIELIDAAVKRGVGFGRRRIQFNRRLNARN